jgi:hypothetical protein
VRIANPIYDVVFKYLLDDEKAARLLLSALLGKEVLELQFRPTEVQITDPYVEALTHDSIVVQTNRLKNRRRTDLERLLEVFDQGLAAQSDPHLLDILEENFAERHREVLRRLMRAGAEQDVEDGRLTAFQEQARESADLRQALVKHAQVIEEQHSLVADLESRLPRT